MKTHAHQAREHALRRARDRIGVPLTATQVAHIVDQIHRGVATPIWKESNSRTWFLVTLVGEDSVEQAVAIYGRKTKTIHTFLTVHQAKRTLDEHCASRLLDALVDLR